MKIEKIDAYQVFDSRGNPTLEAEVVLKNGEKATAIVPSGASTGQYEALELRDNIPDKFQGKSVYQAIDNVRKKIHPALKEKDVFRQSALDEIMLDLDGTDNKHNLGANAILGVSMAAARAAANAADIPLYDYLSDGNGTVIPLPEIQIIGGGAHSAGRIDIQDFMVICTGAPTYADCLEMTFNIYHHCGQILKEENKLAGVADEGGFWPEFSSNQEVFDVILRAIEKAGYKPGKEVHLSLDIAASELYSDGQYHLLLEERSLSAGEFYKVIAGWCEKYPIISIEDPFSETDLENWKRFTEKYGPNMQIIGDDLFTTDIHRVRQGKEDKLANSVLIKLNQIGTVTETIACIKQSQDFNWAPVVSARSGETEDPFIAHLAVATNAGQLKVGSFTRSERMVKWNEVLRIERTLGKRSIFMGKKIYTWM